MTVSCQENNGKYFHFIRSSTDDLQDFPKKECQKAHDDQY